MQHLAGHDVLTDLPNRLLFKEHMEESHARRQRRDRRACSASTWIDFKGVNDTLGHARRRAAARMAASACANASRDGDMIARLGGDEFVMVEGRLEAARATPRRSLARMIDEDRPAVRDRRPSRPDRRKRRHRRCALDGIDADELMKKADLALYRAKADGRGTFNSTDRGWTRHAGAPQPRARLRYAFRRDEFACYYQPLVNLEATAICSASRPCCAGTIPSSVCVPAAVHPAGRGNRADRADRPLGAPRGLRGGGRAGRRTSASRSTCRRSSSGSTAICRAHDGPPSTAPACAPDGWSSRSPRAVLLADNENALPMLRQLQGLGVRLAMDDFGTGYSSLSYLRQFPFDKIKIDPSFIRDSSSSPDSLAIVQAMIGLGRASA